MLNKRISIIQPYFLPYIGYFNLLMASDVVVFYDDVNFIKRGWINRNYIWCFGKEYLFTLPLRNSSQNFKINETELIQDKKTIQKLLKTIELNYSKAPFFSVCYPMISSLFESSTELMSTKAIDSVKLVFDYLDITKTFLKSSDIRTPMLYKYYNEVNCEPADDLICITKYLNGNIYLNPIGGVNLYNKEYFRKSNINLYFVEPKFINYFHGNVQVPPNLSILDILMYNSADEIRKMFASYALI